MLNELCHNWSLQDWLTSKGRQRFLKNFPPSLPPPYLPFPSCILLLGNVIAFWFSISCAVAGELPSLWVHALLLLPDHAPSPACPPACCLCMQRMINKCVSHSAYAGSTLISKHVDISIKKYKSFARPTSSTSQQHPRQQQQQLQL